MSKLATWGATIWLAAIIVTATAAVTNAAVVAAADGDEFAKGFQAYAAADYPQAAQCFRAALTAASSAGTFHNLGNAEWQSGRTGEAIYAWERAHWLDSFNANTIANLRFARKAAQLDTPELTWYEICSTWLPANSWVWIACGSLWLAIAMVLLPGALHWRKTEWHQGCAAVGFAIFLLITPALAGVHSRSKLGVILPKQVLLRLTPTEHGQAIGKVTAGEIARLERKRGDFLFVRTGNDAGGWVERSELGLICQK